MVEIIRGGNNKQEKCVSMTSAYLYDKNLWAKKCEFLI